MGDVDVDALEVVGAGSADCDLVEACSAFCCLMAKLLFSGMRKGIASPGLPESGLGALGGL